jgi:hypothetical protein
LKMCPNKFENTPKLIFKFSKFGQEILKICTEHFENFLVYKMWTKILKIFKFSLNIYKFFNI